MPYKEKVIGKIYWTVGEIAEMFSVATSLVRFWESEFKDLVPKKNKRGHRQYTEKDINKFRDIYYLLKIKYYTLCGAKQELKRIKNGENI